MVPNTNIREEGSHTEVKIENKGKARSRKQKRRHQAPYLRRNPKDEIRAKEHVIRAKQMSMHKGRLNEGQCSESPDSSYRCRPEAIISIISNCEREDTHRTK